MILGRLTLAMLLLSVPAVWGQYSKTDMMKLATDRFDTATKTLKLSPDQATAIKPLIESKYVYIGQVKDVYMASAKDTTSKKTAKDSLKAIHTKYDAQITSVLNPEQLKEWKRLQKDWKNDVAMPKT